ICSAFGACGGSLGVRRSIGQSNLRADHDRARRVSDRSGHTPRSRHLPHGSRRTDTRQSKETRHSNQYSLAHHVLPPWWALSEPPPQFNTSTEGTTAPEWIGRHAGQLVGRGSLGGVLTGKSH